MCELLTRAVQHRSQFMPSAGRATDVALQARLANLGGTALGGSPADFAKLISDEVKKWSRVILAANMKRE